MNNSRIHTRGLTSIIALTSFLIMTVTGIVLYFAPQGRVAYWTHWQFTWLSKTDWINIHIVSSIVFAIAGFFHFYFNWTPLMNYLSGKLAGTLKYKTELIISSALSILMITGSIYLFPPFNYVIELGSYLKGSWVNNEDYEPPFGHAEQASLRTIAKRMDIDLNKAMEELRSNGIEFNSEKESLEEIALSNNITPMDVYAVIKKHGKKIASDKSIIFTPELIEDKFSGRGIGRRTLSWIIQDTGITAGTAIQRLTKNNIKASSNDTLKQIAARHNTEPMEILKVILIKNHKPGQQHN